MKFVFISNYYNHHQKPFCEAMNSLLDGQFVFISTSEMSEERRRLGYGMNEIPEYVMYTYKDEAQAEQCRKLIDEADVVIAGSAPERLLMRRKREGKIILRYHERFLKNGMQIWKYPYLFAKLHLYNPGNKPIYLLSAGAFSADDYEKFGLFKGRAYKWGYFPEAKKYDIDKLINEKKQDEILWCGRFIDWKHPEEAIQAARLLKNDGYKFKLSFIGTGNIRDVMETMIAENALTDCVELHDSMKPEQVREQMEQKGIFLLTSNRREGWGAVLNEAMNSGCAVIASSEAGSVPFMIENDINGMVYESGNARELYEKLKDLLDNSDKQVSLGRNAYATVINQWNAENAAERLIRISEELIKNGVSDVFTEGPCSRMTEPS